mmetsp:Transcript_7547/g.21603  ORF Transcript_7547/g.21603 Transcript_7547/m.21603 type:complete len:205 (+) Transcript_7547:242-856(+)
MASSQPSSSSFQPYASVLFAYRSPSRWRKTPVFWQRRWLGSCRTASWTFQTRPAYWRREPFTASGASACTWLLHAAMAPSTQASQRGTWKNRGRRGETVESSRRSRRRSLRHSLSASCPASSAFIRSNSPSSSIAFSTRRRIQRYSPRTGSSASVAPRRTSTSTTLMPSARAPKTQSSICTPKLSGCVGSQWSSRVQGSTAVVE